MAAIRSDEIGDTSLLFNWLFEKFKSWSPIASKIERIKESGPRSKKRSWNYLWTAILNKLYDVNEDANMAVI